MKVRTITLDLLQRDTLFIYNCTYKQVNKKLEEMGLKDRVNEYIPGAVITDANDDWTIVYIKDITDIPTVVHELMHLVLRICDYYSIPIEIGDEESKFPDEVAAYMIEFFLRELLTPPRTRHSVKE